MTEYTYTSTGLLESIITHVGATISTVGSKTTYTYYTNGWLNETRQGSKNDSTLSLMSKVVQYDAMGNPTIMQDANGSQTKVDYDALGRATKTYMADKDTQETTQDWTNNKYATVTYDLKGNVTSSTDIRGNVTNYTYDNTDRLLTTTQVVTTGNIVNTVVYSEYTYNSTTCLKVTYTDPEGVISIEYYDELGRVRKTAVSDGTTELTRGIVTYDKAGNAVTSKDLIDSTETEYRETTYEYDKLNRQTYTYLYNDDNEIVGTTTAYDYIGNAIQVTDPQNYTDYYYYDGLGRLTRVIEGGYSTYYYYDNIKSYGGVNYLMNYIKDAKNHVKETYLDAYGNPVVEIDQGDTGTTTKRTVVRTFNLDGTVNTVTQADNQVDYYSYNYWGQATLIRYGSSTSTDNQTVYAYYDYGQIQTLTDSKTNSVAGGVITVTTSYAYDQIGRTTSSTQDGTTIQYEYDKAGNITLLSQPTEGDTTTEDTTYEYNGYGQLEYVYQNGEMIREYNYLTTGQTDTMVDYLKFDESNTTQTMTTSYQYTALGQVEEIKYVNDNTSATMEKYTYTYDKRGNILTEYIYNTYGGTTSLTKSYVYNSMNMLTRTTVGTDITDYAYDATGNRYHEESRQTDDYYDKYYYYNEFDQLETVTTNIDHGANDTEHYSYNARGAISYSETKIYNTIVDMYMDFKDVDNDGITDEWIIVWEYPNGTPWLGTVYTYDKSGMLQKTVVDLDVYTTETTGHFYNGMEQRVRKIVGSTTTKYIYAGSEMLFTTDGNNAKLTENILSTNGQIIASQRFNDSYEGNYYFYNQDIRNSTGLLGRAINSAEFMTSHVHNKRQLLGSKILQV